MNETSTIELLFTATDRTGSVISSIGSQMETLSGSVGAVTAPFASITEAVIKADAALVAMAVGGMAVSVNAAGKFNGSVSEISTLINDTGFDIGTFKDHILDYSKNSTASIKDINSAIYSAVSAGTDYKDAINAVAQAEKLAVAGKAGLNESTVLLAGTLNAYGEEMTAAEEYSDVFFQTVKLGQTTLPELAAGLSQITSLAASADIPIQTVGAALATLTSNGVPTSQAITAVRGAISAIIKPTSEAQQVAKDLGIEFNASGLASRGFEGLLQDVYKATGGNVEQIGKLFGNVEALTGVLSTFGNDGGKKFLENLEAMQDAAGSTAKAYAEMEKAFANINQKLKNNVEGTLIKVGERLLDSYGDLAKGLGAVFNGVTIGVDKGAFDPLFDALNTTAGEIAKSMEDIAKALPKALADVDFDGFLDAMGDIEEALMGLFDGIDLTTPEGLSEAIQGVVDTLTSLVNFSKGIAEVFVAIGKEVFGLIERFNALDEKTKAQIGSISGLGAALNLFTGPVGQVADAISGMGTAMNVVAATQVAGLVKSLVGTGGLRAAFTAIHSHPLVAAGVAGLAIGTAARHAIPQIDGMAQSVFEAIHKYTGLIGVETKYQDTQKEGVVVLERFRQVMADQATAAGEAAGKDKEYFESVVDGADDAANSTFYLTEALRKSGALVEEKKTLNVDTAEATGKVEGFYKTITEIRDGKKWLVKIPVDTSQVTAAKKEIEEIPADKLLKIETDLEIEKIKADAATIQTAMEVKAKVDMTEIEAAAEQVVALSGNISDMFQNTGQTTTGLYDAWDSGSSLQEKWSIRESLNAEQDRRDKTLEMQEKLNTAQVEYMEARTEAIDRGESTITVNADNLAPILTELLRSLLELVQLEVTNEGLEAMQLGVVPS